MVETIPWEALTPPQLSNSSDDLVIAYGYLCRRAARKFWRSGLERCDLEQVAAIGLIKASRRYDSKTRTPFEAYAWMLVVGELMHFVRDFERPIRVPRRLRTLERKANAAHETLLSRLRREPTDDELANELGVLRATIAELRYARDTSSFSAIADEDTLGEDTYSTIGFEDRFIVDASFKTLGEIEKQVLVGVYVLGLSQLEMARRLGISAKRVSRALHTALDRMQRALAS